MEKVLGALNGDVLGPGGVGPPIQVTRDSPGDM